MKIAILGYGKMGKVIERIALERGHSISLKTTSQSTTIDLSNTDIAIDFSVPQSAVKNIETCFNQNTPVVSGTTGWLDAYEAVESRCKECNGAFIYSSNFSLGVNMFFEINNKLAKMMSKFNTYRVAIEETHHTEKLDAPSGTAISLANDIIKHTKHNDWHLTNEDIQESLPITANRIKNIPGTHNISYTSEIDSITINHTAHNRNGFALGAIIAAEWLHGKTGVYTMRDVLELT